MAKERLNILFLPKWYPSKIDPLDGNFIENHARAISQFCKVNILFVSSYPNKNGTYESEITTEYGNTVVRVFYKKVAWQFPVISSLIKIWRYVKATFLGYRIIKDKCGTPDICHVHVLSRNGLLARYLKWRRHIPYLITEHWSGYLPERNEYKGFLKPWVTKFVVKRTSCITTVSSYLEKAMKAHGLHGTYKVIPNTIDTELFKPGNQEKSSEKIKILHISTLDEKNKNTGGIIRAFEKAGLNREGLELHIYGNGSDRKLQEEQAEKLGLLNSRVFFYGDQPQETIAKSMQEAAFLILFSKYENQGMVLIESWASGIPVIATNAGGIPEIMTKERGIMIHPKDENGLSRAIEELSANYGDYNSETLRNYVIKNFSMKAVGKRFIAIYQDILQHQDK